MTKTDTQANHRMGETVDVRWHAHAVSRDEREQAAGHRGCVLWFTGLSGCGKSTLANLVDHRLHGAQHGVFFAIGIDQPLAVLFGAFKHRLHQQHGLEDELAELVAIGVEIGNRPRGDPAFHRRARHCRRQRGDEARVKRLGNEIFAPEAQLLAQQTPEVHSQIKAMD